jgi:hypothetical protein
MHRIAYDIVSIQANHILIKMIAAPIWEANNYFDLYFSYLEVCGWTDKEFDDEMMSRIDSSWEELPNLQLN